MRIEIEEQVYREWLLCQGMFPSSNLFSILLVHNSMKYLIFNFLIMKITKKATFPNTIGHNFRVSRY